MAIMSGAAFVVGVDVVQPKAESIILEIGKFRMDDPEK
jgi:hypothetical protein